MTSHTTLAFVLSIMVLGQGLAPAADLGMQFIGASRATLPDIQATAIALRTAGGRAQVGLLPFEFNPEAPFANATALVQQTLPGMNGSLTVTVYVGWHPHDARGRREQRVFWDAWQASRLTADHRLLREAYLERVRAADRWIVTMLRWAKSNGYAGRLDFVVVPILEDTCPSSYRTAYQRLVRAIRSVQELDGVTRTSLRRSCLDDNIFRPDGLALELHGPWKSVRSQLASGDTWSNDGTTYDREADFLADATAALDRGVTVLLWRDVYNGFPKGSGFERNWTQRSVTPFSGPGGAAELRLLQRVLRIR